MKAPNHDQHLNRQTPLTRDIVSDLCRQHHAAVFRYAFYRIGHRADAEDLAADVFVRLLQTTPERAETVLGLIYRIAENLVIDYYRKRETRRRTFSASTLDDLVDRAGFEPHDPTVNVDLQRGLQCLAGEQYQVIILRFLEGLSVQEVADILGKSAGAVKALQFRALQNMRTVLTDHDTRP